MAVIMKPLGLIYAAFIDCIKEHRWEDIEMFLQPQFSKNDKPYDSASFAAELQANGDTEIQLDSVTVDEKGQRIASTILVKWKPSKKLIGIDPPDKQILFMEQHFNWFVEGKLSRTISMPDHAAVHRQLNHPELPYGPDLVGTDSALAVASEPITSGNLAAVYEAYIKCINDRKMSLQLMEFVHAHVIFDGMGLTLEKFRQRMESVITAIPDLFAVIHTIITDDQTQRLAAQLESSGTLVKPLAGLEAVGTQVTFAEHCTYEFRGGKIARIWSLANWGKLGQTKLT
ncbi:hypothetical protein LQW54_006143 [Pestalotiopsis sp. IQ-011]